MKDPQKYKGKYRIPSARASWWDYGWNGAYFITICTKDRLPYFGYIREGEMELSPVGALADVFWYQIPQRLPHLTLGAYVIMPNHMHGVLILDKPDGDSHPDGHNRGVVETLHATSLPEPENKPQNLNLQMKSISPVAGTVSTIIRSYKSAVTQHARRLGFTFAWQSRFHDHIIRDAASYDRISQYIQNNVQQWENDSFHLP